MIPFNGVLISCDMFDKNADFNRSDSSAFSLALIKSAAIQTGKNILVN